MAETNGCIAIIGGGHAAAQLCGALAAAGRGADVTLICEESELPYHRPPLSKAFLKDPTARLQSIRPESWYSEAGIRVHRGDPAIAIDRVQRLVRLRSGASISYETLVIATGSRARRLPHLPETLTNVAVVRSAADAVRMREWLSGCGSAVVVGGGFIGLEIAATARALGKAVQVLESAPRLLMRAVSPELSQHVLDVHRGNGIDVRVGVSVGEFGIEGDRLARLGVDGVLQDVDLVVLGIGAMPEHDLATAAGLHCENGILVDAHMRTSDPAVLAIGDCTLFPEHLTGRRLRLESVQNANDQARTACASIIGEPLPYSAVPWFWSDQGDMRLQMVGLMPSDPVSCRRPGASLNSFSLLHYVGERLACVESVNAPKDHLAARKLLESGATVPPALACNPAHPLKAA